jgi:hypothetical protein
VAVITLTNAGAGAPNRHVHHFTVVTHNDQGSTTPTDFFDTLAHNAQASLDSPVSLSGRMVGAAETILRHAQWPAA